MRQRILSVAYMCAITLIFTSMVSAVKLLTQDRIELNRALKMERIVITVLGMEPPGKPSMRQIHQLFRSRVKKISVKSRPFYIGYSKDGSSITGYAFPVSGPGFWGPIYAMVGVDPQGTKILGISFYKHSETPGLGGRMTEKWFTDQFSGLSLRPVQGGNKIFFLKQPGTGRAPNELDAITGATRTSQAIEKFLNSELEVFEKKFWGKLKRS